jgi:hypothetical protein
VRTLEARLLDSGDLVIEGQILGLKKEEYEWTITVRAHVLPGLAAALGGTQHEADVLCLLAARFAEDERYATREFLEEHRIPHDFWSRASGSPPEGIETFLGVPVPAEERAMTTWTVAGQVVGEAGPGLWVRVKRLLLPNGEEMPLPEEPVYFLRWELLMTARLYDALPADVRRNG